MANWSKEKRRYMIAKSQYEAAIRMHDWKWADRIEPELKEAKEAFEQAQANTGA